MEVGETFSSKRQPNSVDHSCCVVYQIRNVTNGRIYVGSAKRFDRRFASYRGFMRGTRKPQTAIEHAIVKHGFDSFEFTILEMPTIESRFEREQTWIDSLRPFRDRGYNLSRITRYIPENCRRERTEEKTLKARERSRKTGLKYAEETRTRSSKAVLQIDIDSGAVVQEFLSAIEADRKLGLTVNTVNKVCRKHKKHRTAKGYAWCYKQDYESGRFVLPSRRKIVLTAAYYLDVKPVMMCDMNGTPVTVWDSVKSIREATGFCESVILRCCRNERKHGYGFTWRFLDDQAQISQIRERRKQWYEQRKFEAA